MAPLFRTLAGIILGGMGARLLALLGRFHSSPHDARKKTSRRLFTRNAALGAAGVVLAELGAGFVVFFWPNRTGAFGSEITVPADQVPAVGDPPFRNAAGKFFLIHSEDGLMALYTKCPHLGCSVPYLANADPPFQCPCHGSHYNYVGERVAGPAPRPMDYMALSTDAEGNVIVDTGAISQRGAYAPDQTMTY